MNNKKIKTLFVLPSLTGGGAERITIDLINLLDRNKFEVHLLLFGGHGEISEKEIKETKLIYLEGSKIPKNKLLKFLLLCYRYPKFKLIKRFPKYFITRKLKSKYDYAHISHHSIMDHFQGLSIADHIIPWIHTDPMIIKEKSPKVYEAIKSASTIVCCSSTVADTFLKMGNDGHEVLTFDNFIPKSEILDKSEKDALIPDRLEKWVLISVGRLNYYKNITDTILVLKHLQELGISVELWIVGSGKEEAKLKQMASEQGLKQHVKFLGFQSNPYPYIKAADFLISTSRFEGYPLSFLESMYLDTPIISYDHIGAKQVLAEGKYGIMTESNPEDMSKVIFEVLSDDERIYQLQEMNRRGKEHIVGPKEYVEKFVKHFS